MDALGLHDVVLKFLLALVLDIKELLHKLLVSGIVLDLADHSHLGNPVVIVSNGVRYQLREARVAAVQPPARGDSVSHVQELSWVELEEILED
jgi:hypothetical protein